MVKKKNAAPIKRSSKNPRKLKVILFLSLIIVPMLTFYFGLHSQKFFKNNRAESGLQSNCTYYGPQPLEKYLDSYTVKSGDTLLSIAQATLGDNSRVHELIQLNKLRYPSLSLSSPFVEVGWKFLIPPSDIKKSSGNLKILSGEITKSDNSKIEIVTSIMAGKTYNYLHPNDETVYKTSAPALGDCITAIIDETSDGGRQTKVILPQN